jgi:hypothetical protein
MGRVREETTVDEVEAVRNISGELLGAITLLRRAGSKPVGNDRHKARPVIESNKRK